MRSSCVFLLFATTALVIVSATADLSTCLGLPHCTIGLEDAVVKNHKPELCRKLEEVLDCVGSLLPMCRNQIWRQRIQSTYNSVLSNWRNHCTTG